MSEKASINIILIVLMSMLLTACPIPLPRGDTSDSRQNVGDVVPDFIIAGKTTRSDVLLALGEPDGITEHGERFTYTRRTREGGVMFVMAAGSSAGGVSTETLTYRRLIVTFDGSGIVTNAHSEQVSCTERELMMGQGIRSTPCVSASGHDLYLSSIGTVFTPSLWHQGVHGFELIRGFHLESPAINGSLVVGETHIYFFLSDADSKSEPRLGISYADIENISVETFGFNKRVVIKRLSGMYESFSVSYGVSVDSKTTEVAGNLAKSRWQSVNR
jgi:outer membrane protein assembly factor BamE (lipoprotein component of BamABCDE complex)